MFVLMYCDSRRGWRYLVRQGRILVFFFALAALTGCTEERISPVDQQDPGVESSMLDDDEPWGRFLSWWPGDYDNLEQVRQLAAKGEASSILPTSLHIRRVELPVFGSDVYYAEWRNPDDPKDITRQRIYAFEREGSTLRLNLHIFPPDEAFITRTAGAFNDPSKLEGVTLQDMYPLPGCDVFFEWNGENFSGAMKKQSCNFPAPGSEVPIYSWSQMRLQANAFQYLDGWFHRSDDSVYQQFSEHWVVFEKRDGPE